MRRIARALFFTKYIKESHHEKVVCICVIQNFSTDFKLEIGNSYEISLVHRIAHCPTSWKVAGSICDGIIGSFH